MYLLAFAFGGCGKWHALCVLLPGRRIPDNRAMGQDNRGMGLFTIYKMQQAEVDGHSRPHSKKSSPLLSYPDIQE